MISYCASVSAPENAQNGESQKRLSNFDFDRSVASVLLALSHSKGFQTERPFYWTNTTDRLCQQQALSCDSDNLENGGGCISPRVAARSPGKASSYLYAMKGEARRRRLIMLGSIRNKGRPAQGKLSLSPPE